MPTLRIDRVPGCCVQGWHKLGARLCVCAGTFLPVPSHPGHVRPEPADVGQDRRVQGHVRAVLCRHRILRGWDLVRPTGYIKTRLPCYGERLDRREHSRGYELWGKFVRRMVKMSTREF